MCRVGHPPRLEIPRRDPRPDVGQLGQRGLEQREVGVTTATVAPGLPDARERRDRGHIAAAEVDEREAALRGWLVGPAGELHPAGQPLHRVVVASLPRPRACHPEAGQRDADEARVEVLEVREAEAQLLRLVAAQVRDHGVRDPDEVLEHAPRLGMPQIERERALVPVEALEEERVRPLRDREARSGRRRRRPTDPRS